MSDLTPMAGKFHSLTLLVVAETLGMCLWFSSAAVLAEMNQETAISPLRQALLSSGVQFGFAAGAVFYAVLGLPDRFDPRRVFALSAGLAAVANLTLLIAPIGGFAAICARIATGALLAGVYPVGMKIAVGWGDRDRGLLVGLLVGALTLGSASPHLVAFWGGTDWRLTVTVTSALALAGGLLVLAAGLGPFHARAPAFDISAIKLAWTDRRIRLAYAGYLGHMWELYAFWAWIGIAMTAAFSAHMSTDEANALAKITAFGAVAIGAISCVVAGLLGDRIGKAETTIIAMVGSGTAAVASALAFDSAAPVLIALVLIWGAFVVADSAQFSALVADFAPPDRAGTLLTFQTALGFALTVFTVQVTPLVADVTGWPGLFVILAIGPALGTAAMVRLIRRTVSQESRS